MVEYNHHKCPLHIYPMEYYAFVHIILVSGILTYLPDKPLAAHGIIVNEARPEDKLERAQVGKSLHVRWIQTLSKQE